MKFIDLFCGIGGFHYALQKHNLSFEHLNLSTNKKQRQLFNTLPMTSWMSVMIPKYSQSLSLKVNWELMQ